MTQLVEIAGKSGGSSVVELVETTREAARN